MTGLACSEDEVLESLGTNEFEKSFSKRELQERSRVNGERFPRLREIRGLYYSWLGSISVEELAYNDFLAGRARRFEVLLNLALNHRDKTAGDSKTCGQYRSRRDQCESM